MTPGEAAAALAGCRTDDAGESVDAMVALYRTLGPQDRAAVHEALSGWLGGEDARDRDDALFVVHELRMTGAGDAEALDALVAEAYWGTWDPPG